MGPTHALGGATALAALSTLTGHPDQAPVWAFGVAALAALVPDADNGRGSMLNRIYFLPIKAATLPLWAGAAHRGRTHSLLGTAFFGLIVAFWIWLFNAASAAAGQPSDLPLTIILGAALVGYLSHLALDLMNVPGMLLLWPLPLRIFFPPWRQLRFPTASIRENFLVSLPMTAFAGWFAIQHGLDVLSTTRSEGSIFRVLSSLVAMLLALGHFFFGLFSGGGS